MTPRTILLVEDDELMGALFQLVLVDAGCRVTWIRGGQEALSRLTDDASLFDALITDINLGQGPNGWQVARHARMHRPMLPVIYLTGGHGAEWGREHVALGVMLQKPFNVDQMVDLLNDLLDAEPAPELRARLA